MPEVKATIPPLQYFPWPGKNKPHEIVGWFNGRIRYWNKAVDEISIWSTRLTEISRTIYTMILMLFGVFGLGVGIFKVADILNDDLSFQLLWEAREPEFIIFWVSVLVDCYIFYRFAWLQQHRKKIEMEAPAPLEFHHAEYATIAKLPPKTWMEISAYFSPEANKAVERAVSFAASLKHDQVDPIHLLMVIAKEKQVAVMFARLGIPPKILMDHINKSLRKIKKSNSASPDLSQSFHQLLLGAYEEAYRRRGNQVEIPDLFTAIMKTGKVAQAILYDLDVEADELRNVVIWSMIQADLRKQMRRYRARARFKPKNTMNRAMTAVATPFLDKFSQDYTLMAKAGALDYCVDRNDEIESIFRAVEAGNNGIVLVGNPGVGRKTIVAGLAERMVTEDVPPVFEDKRLVSLSISALVAGASAPGQLEERLLGIMAEAGRSGNIVFFIEDIHNMIGVNTEGGQGLDLSEVFAEFIQKQAFIVITSTNPTEYRRYVERSSIGEILHKVNVDEMDETQTIHVLEAKSGYIEYQQKVFFSYESIAAIVRLAKRYVYEKFFPEKAIQLMEEVASYVRRTKGVKNIVTAEDVAQVISARVKVPVTKVTQKESVKLLQLEQRIHQRLVDQEEAVNMVAAALRRARAELRDLKRPIVNLLFLGPTGVGKTELSKTVAEAYFGSEDSMIRIDMSEYQTKESIKRLIGASPGMAKGEEGGYLTEAVRRTPFSLLLLDEIEKAHPDILNLFLQVFDDGRLTDSQGRTIDFTNTIIIATSNAGTPLIQKMVKEGVPVEKIRDELIDKELSKYYRPEFLNRFDGIMVFKPLSPEDLYKIAELLLIKVARRLEDKGIMLQATAEAIKELVKEGYDPAFGARPLRRVIQNKVDNALANFLLQGKLTRRDIAILEPGGVIRVEKAESFK